MEIAFVFLQNMYDIKLLTFFPLRFLKNLPSDVWLSLFPLLFIIIIIIIALNLPLDYTVFVCCFGNFL